MTEDFDLKNFQKRFNDIVAENTRLQYIKEQYHSISIQCADMSTQLKEIAASLSPVFAATRSRKPNGTNIDKADRLSILYEKMAAGMELDSFIIAQVMELESHHVSYWMDKLLTMPNVEERRDKRKRFLYIRKGGD